MIQMTLSWTDALGISALSILIVFLILFAMSVLIGLFKHLDRPKEPVIQDPQEDEDMMVALLIASIDYRQTHQTDFKIRSIREIKS